MIVENQQITAVVDRRRTVLRNDLSAQRLPYTPVVGRHHRPRYAPLRRPHAPAPASPPAAGCAEPRTSPHPHDSGQTSCNRSGSSDFAAVRPAAGICPRLSGPRKATVARKQSVAHEHLAHDVVDERRMHPVTAEITGAGEAVAQFCDTSGQPERKGVSAESHRLYFLSIPARRPVEKAI